MSFNGWLIKFGSVALPNSFLLADGWESTPNQRVETDAYRDANVLLHRETSPNFKTSIKLTIAELTLAEMEAFRNVIGLATLPETYKNQRRVEVTYWNDEELAYKTGIFYMPDVTYTIHTVKEDGSDIIYNSFSVELTEY